VTGLTWHEIIKGLRHSQSQLRLAASRTRSGALMLDDSYNASPESTLAALNLLAELDGRRVAVLGGMFELGQYEKTGHEMVGIRAAEVADELLTVGELASEIANTAIRNGMSAQRVNSVKDNDEAVDFLSTRLHSGDVVLVKGSHGLRMDHIVAALEEVE
jgi:UDP-N-acetylmuramoyl-tripeptide--D-alanyl-D-alanine ligase